MKRLFIFCLLILCFGNVQAQVKVTIRLSGLPAKTLAPADFFLAGSFNNWNAGSADWKLIASNSGQYSRSFNMAPGNYEFKITRGTWNTVESMANGGDAVNRDMHVLHDTIINLTVTDWKDNYPIAAKKHTASSHVHIISEAFNMPQLNRNRRVWIYLPEGYETAKIRYPVIYMHDGQNLFDEYTSGFGEWGVDEFLDSLKTGQQQFIVVGIDHGGDLRMTEYSPYDSNYAKGTGDAYVSFLVETLKPYIDSHYHTLSDTKHTTIAGSSMGGLISMYANVKYPKVFGNAGIFSPAFWVNPAIYNYAKFNVNKSSRFYFVCGDLESAKETDDMNKMVAILKEKGFTDKNAPATVITGAKHNEQQWRGDFPAFYQWLVSK